ncbi:MAG: family 16 glycosylhydrolase [Candidatus Nanopelagicales bacterium]
MSPHRHAEHQSKLKFLLQSAAALASTTVVTAGLGFVYWAVAARAFPAIAVGESSTAITAVSLIAPLTVLGFGTLLLAELPTMKQGRSTLLSTAALLTGVVASAVALGCAFGLPSDFLGLPEIGSRPAVALIFAATVATQCIGLLFDQALLSVVGGGMQLRRNLVQSVVKLVLLIVFALTLARFGSLAIFTSWLLANIASLGFGVVMLMRRYHVPLRRLVPVPAALHGLHFDAARHHVLNIAMFVPYFAMPIVANVVLGSQQAAYFYAAWSVASFVFFLPMALSTALFASGARDSSTLLMEFRKTLRYSLLACTAANVGVVVLGRPVLHIFGEPYAAYGYAPLIVLCLGGLGLVVKDHHVTLARLTDDVGREALLVGAFSIVEVAAAAFGAWRGGLTGLTLGWLAAVGLGAVVYGPRVWRAYRGGAMAVRGTSAALVAVLAVTSSMCTGVVGTSSAAPIASGPVFEDFLGPTGAPPNPALWTTDIGPSAEHGWERGSLQTYTDSPENIRLDGYGNLVIEARKSSDGYTSGRLVTRGKLLFPYGTVAARIKMPAGQGIWPAFWMLGANIDAVGWPQSGEIDIMELINTGKTYNVALHAPNADVEQKGEIADLAADFHDYWMTRREHSVTVGVDDTTLATFTPDSLPKESEWVFDKLMFALLNVAVGGDWPGPPDSSTHFPAAMVVDWFSYQPLGARNGLEGQR